MSEQSGLVQRQTDDADTQNAPEPRCCFPAWHSSQSELPSWIRAGCNLRLLLFGIAHTYRTGGHRHSSRLEVNVPSSAEVAARPQEACQQSESWWKRSLRDFFPGKTKVAVLQGLSRRSLVLLLKASSCLCLHIPIALLMLALTPG
ncbi:uncharacterized protein ACIB01_013323 [Guaruba guarouba]